MPVLCFSIDLSNSTYAKQKISQICKKKNWEKTLLKKYNDFLLGLEQSLYNLSIRQIELLEKLYLVKNIGDELWYIFEFNLNKDSQLLKILLQYLYEIVSSIFRLMVTPEDIFTDEKFLEHQSSITNVCLGVKVTVDILEHSIDFSKERVDKLMKVLPDLIKRNNPEISDKELNSKLKHIAPRLNLGNFEFKKKYYYLDPVRSDPIGTSVDRFFRCTKFAMPGILAIGHQLVKVIKAELTENNSLEFSFGNNIKREMFQFPVIQEKVLATDMKGILKDYNIFHCPSSKFEIFNSNSLCTDDIYSVSRNFLIKNNFLSVECRRNQNKW